MSTTPEVAALHRRAVENVGGLVARIGADQWGTPTPCSAWNVRELVNHLASENAWTAPLFDGQTIADVGDRFDGDVLGDQPGVVWSSYADEAVGAVSEPGALERTVHLSFGDFPGREYAMQLFADMLIHGWDLARAIGADERLDPDLVDALSGWFAGVADLYRQGGAVGPRADVPDDADAQTRLLADFGRST